MESTEKTVSNETGQFRKCVYPYCRNMAMATDDYCALHQHSKLLVKHANKKNPPKKVIKVAAKVMAKALKTRAGAPVAAQLPFVVKVEAATRRYGNYPAAKEFVEDLMRIGMIGISLTKEAS
ncbi:MAG TPA: hypothetical protein VGB78_05570 [Thermoplasmata archaeon]|jgi:hypothetical protein